MQGNAFGSSSSQHQSAYPPEERFINYNQREEPIQRRDFGPAQYSYHDKGKKREEVDTISQRSIDSHETVTEDDAFYSNQLTNSYSNSTDFNPPTALSSSSILPPVIAPWFEGGRRGRGEGTFAEEFTPLTTRISSVPSEYLLQGDFLSKINSTAPEGENYAELKDSIETKLLNKPVESVPALHNKLTKRPPRRHSISVSEIQEVAESTAMSISLSSSSGKKLVKKHQGWTVIKPLSKEDWYAERGFED